MMLVLVVRSVVVGAGLAVILIVRVLVRCVVRMLLMRLLTQVLVLKVCSGLVPVGLNSLFMMLLVMSLVVVRVVVLILVSPVAMMRIATLRLVNVVSRLIVFGTGWAVGTLRMVQQVWHVVMRLLTGVLGTYWGKVDLNGRLTALCILLGLGIMLQEWYIRATVLTTELVELMSATLRLKLMM